MRRVSRLPFSQGSQLVVAMRPRGFASQAELLRYLDVFRGPASARREPPVSGFSTVHEAFEEGEPGEGSLFRVR